MARLVSSKTLALRALEDTSDPQKFIAPLERPKSEHADSRFWGGAGAGI